MRKRYAIVEECLDDDGRIISQRHVNREFVMCRDCIHWVSCGCIYENGLRGVTYGSSYCDRGDRREE